MTQRNRSARSLSRLTRTPHPELHGRLQESGGGATMDDEEPSKKSHTSVSNLFALFSSNPSQQSQDNNNLTYAARQLQGGGHSHADTLGTRRRQEQLEHGFGSSEDSAIAPSERKQATATKDDNTTIVANTDTADTDTSNSHEQQTKSRTSKPSSPSEISVLYGVPIVQLYRVDNANENDGGRSEGGHTAMGAAGLAILGDQEEGSTASVSPTSRFLLLYDAMKRPFLQERILASFRIVPQPGNYATFYAADGRGWSILMRSSEDWDELAREVVIARYAQGMAVAAEAASSKHTGDTSALPVADAIVTMDLTPVPAGEEPLLTVAPWDTVQLTYRVYDDAVARNGYTDGYSAGKYAAIGGAVTNAEPIYAAEAVRMELNPTTAPRGLAAGLCGLVKGGRRLVLVPAGAVAEGLIPPSQPTSSPSVFLLYDATVSRIKKAKLMMPPTVSAGAEADKCTAAAAAALQIRVEVPTAATHELMRESPCMQWQQMEADKEVLLVAMAAPAAGVVEPRSEDAARVTIAARMARLAGAGGHGTPMMMMGVGKTPSFPAQYQEQEQGQHGTDTQGVTLWPDSQQQQHLESPEAASPPEFDSQLASSSSVAQYSPPQGHHKHQHQGSAVGMSHHLLTANTVSLPQQHRQPAPLQHSAAVNLVAPGAAYGVNNRPPQPHQKAPSHQQQEYAHDDRSPAIAAGDEGPSGGVPPGTAGASGLAGIIVNPSLNDVVTLHESVMDIRRQMETLVESVGSMAGRARVSGVWVPPEPKGETQLALIALRTLRAKMCLPEMVAVDTLTLTDLRQLTGLPYDAAELQRLQTAQIEAQGARGAAEELEMMRGELGAAKAHLVAVQAEAAAAAVRAVERATEMARRANEEAGELLAGPGAKSAVETEEEDVRTVATRSAMHVVKVEAEMMDKSRNETAIYVENLERNLAAAEEQIRRAAEENAAASHQRDCVSMIDTHPSSRSSLVNAASTASAEVLIPASKVSSMDEERRLNANDQETDENKQGRQLKVNTASNYDGGGQALTQDDVDKNGDTPSEANADEDVNAVASKPTLTTTDPANIADVVGSISVGEQSTGREEDEKRVDDLVAIALTARVREVLGDVYASLSGGMEPQGTYTGSQVSAALRKVMKHALNSIKVRE